MDEEQARRELRTALKARRRQQQFAMVALGIVVIAGFVIAGTSFAVQRQFSPEQLLPVLYGGIAYLAWRLGLRPVDTSGDLVRCVVVHPYGMGGRGLRIRRPDGAILAVPLADDKGAVVDAGDELWCLDPREGRRLVGVRWNPFLHQGEVVTGAARARMVVPPGAVPRALAGAGVQDAPTAAAAPGRRAPLAIKPLGPPPPEPPDGIDENQARAALAGAASGPWGRAGRPATAPDVPLEVVAVASAAPSGFGVRTGDLAIRRADGQRYAWPVALERWPARGSTAWATRVIDDVDVRLVVPTPTGDVQVVEPKGAAHRTEADARD